MFVKNRITLLILTLLLSITCNAGRHIKLRINDSYGPFEYISSDGKPVGFTVDVFNSINNIDRFDYHIVTNKNIFNFYSTKLDSSEIVTSIQSVPATGEFIVSDPFGYIDNDIVTRLYSNIETWRDLNGKTILIQKNSPLIELFNHQKIDVKYVYIKSIPDGLRMLSTGKYDAMMCSNDVAYFYINRLKLTNLNIKTFFTQPIPIRFVMINSLENNKVIDKINKSLKTIKSNGTYDLIYSKRFYPEVRDSLTKFELWVMIICTVVIMALMIYILYIHWVYQAEKNKYSQTPTPLVTSLGRIFESLPTPIVFYDVVGQIKFLNQPAIELMNFNKSVKLHQGEHTLFDYTILNAEMIEDLHDNKPIQFTYDLINEESLFNYMGDYALPHNRIFNIHIIPACNFKTPIHGYFAYIYDITDLRNATHNNLKYITSLSQITDNSLLEICFYDSFDNMFYTFEKNEVIKTGITYEQILTYIHPLTRSIFIDEFLSILNGEKRRAKLTINRNNNETKDYTPCELTLNAIRVDNNTIIGISIVVTPSHTNQPILFKNKELEEDMIFLSSSSGYRFIEYSPIEDILCIKTAENTTKTLTSEQAFNHIHTGDVEKVRETIEGLKSKQIDKAYLVVRFSQDNSMSYNFYEIHLQTKSDNLRNYKIVGVYHNINEQLMRIKEHEEFKEIVNITCENNNMGYFEYYVDESDNTLIPDVISTNYGIDDNNITGSMDLDSIERYKAFISLINMRCEDIDNISLNIKSPRTGLHVVLEINIMPIKDEVTQTVNKYIGFVKATTP